MKHWLDSLGYHDYSLTPASEDASFRSYHRLSQGGQSWIVMDAPPEQESCDQFIHIAEKISAVGLTAPEIIEKNLQQGYLLLTDFGDTSYLSVLDTDTEASLYRDAMAALLTMQKRLDADDLPRYDENLLNREMDLFRDWFLRELLGIDLSESQLSRWDSIKKILIHSALEQPQVFVHRDYHSRNLMKIPAGNPGILDFQDAVKGPITYDLVSLLRDCYIDWPGARVDQLVLDYYILTIVNKLTDAKSDQFIHWFNQMGIQRHLKAIGIFSRLKIRDGKAGYLWDIPRTLNYLVQASADEASMMELSSLISELDLSARVASIS